MLEARPRQPVLDVVVRREVHRLEDRTLNLEAAFSAGGNIDVDDVDAAKVPLESGLDLRPPPKTQPSTMRFTPSWATMSAVFQERPRTARSMDETMRSCASAKVSPSGRDRAPSAQASSKE